MTGDRIDKALIRERFAKAIGTYDREASVQRHIAVQMCEMLGSICIKTGYQLLKEHKIKYFHIGRKYMIPKVCVIDYILSSVQSKPNRKIEKEDNLNYPLIVQ